MSSTYKVVETPHATPEFEKVLVEFNTRHEALITSVKALKASLNQLCESGLNSKELLERWLSQGIGYRIDPEDSSAPFSDLDFVRLFVLRLTNDYAHPLYLEVSTVDALLTANGVMSPQRAWKFWVRCPASYEVAGLEPLMNAAVGLLYDNMSQQSMQIDGSKYVLHSMKFRAVDAADAVGAIEADRSATVFFVQNDGSFAKSVPINPMLAKA